MDGQDRRQVQGFVCERRGMNGMRYLFRTISGIGFVTALIGCGMWDSSTLLIPAIVTFGGICVTYVGTKLEDAYV